MVKKIEPLGALEEGPKGNFWEVDSPQFQLSFFFERGGGLFCLGVFSCRGKKSHITYQDL